VAAAKRGKSPPHAMIRLLIKCKTMRIVFIIEIAFSWSLTWSKMRPGLNRNHYQLCDEFVLHLSWFLNIVKTENSHFFKLQATQWVFWRIAVSSLLFVMPRQGPEGHLVLDFETDVSPPVQIPKTMIILTKITVFTSSSMSRAIHLGLLEFI